MPLMEFQLSIAKALSKAGKSLVKLARDRPALVEILPKHLAPKRTTIESRPVSDVQYDQLGHWPQHSSKNRCKRCDKGYSRWKCIKCDIHLCMNAESNCFYSFHNK